MLTEWGGVPVNEPFLRDTIDVPYWDGKSARYPSVTLRMDFRNPDAAGTFVYHCHLLEHEDGGYNPYSAQVKCPRERGRQIRKLSRNGLEEIARGRDLRRVVR